MNFGDEQNRQRQRRVRLFLYALGAAAMLAMAALTRTEMLTDWDSWEYASLAVAGKPSDLCLRRWWFIFFMRGSWLAGKTFGVPLEYCYVPMQIAVSLVSAGAVVAVMHLAYMMSRRAGVSAMSGLMLLASPVIAVYCSSVMTELPTVLFLALAFIGWELSVRRSRRGANHGLLWAGAGGLAFGVAVIHREPVLLMCAWPVVSCFIDRPAGRRRRLALAAVGALFTVAIGVGMAWKTSGVDPWTSLQNYAAYMNKERETFGGRYLGNILFLFSHFAVAGPLISIALVLYGIRYAFIRNNSETDRERENSLRRFKWLGVSLIPYFVVTWYNPDLIFNFRLMIPAVAVFAPVGGGALEASFAWLGRRLNLNICAGIALAAAFSVCLAGLILWMSYYHYFQWHFASARHLGGIYRVLKNLPRNSMVIPGPGTPVAIYIRRTGIRGDLHNFKTGFGWSGEMLAWNVRKHLSCGRRCFVNANKFGWVRPSGPNSDHEWRALNEMIRQCEVRPAPPPFVELRLRRKDSPDPAATGPG